MVAPRHDRARPLLLVMGDSKTAGATWPEEVKRTLESTTGQQWDLINMGDGGKKLGGSYDAAAILERLPDHDSVTVLINFGVNNIIPCSTCTDPAEQVKPGVAGIEASYLRLIDQVRKKYRRSIVYFMVPWRESDVDHPNMDAVSSFFRERIEHVAAMRPGVHVGPDESVWLRGKTRDGVHYAESGQVECAQQWSGVLPPSVHVAAAAVPGDRWEYITFAPPDVVYEETLNRLGGEGWELVTARRVNTTLVGTHMAYEVTLRRRWRAGSRPTTGEAQLAIARKAAEPKELAALDATIAAGEKYVRDVERARGIEPRTTASAVAPLEPGTIVYADLGTRLYYVSRCIHPAKAEKMILSDAVANGFRLAPGSCTPDPFSR